MSDIFISYSRKDQDFVRRMFEAFHEQGFDAWVDWEGIPPTVDWLAEIYLAIERSNAFLFIITPASIQSEICNIELDHAVKLQKRIIPVMREEPKGLEMNPILSQHNWIQAESEDKFEAAFKTIIESISLDIDWVHEHTRLLTRASVWEKNNKHSSFLLQGRDLKTARQWLNKVDEKTDPQPSELQHQYLKASSLRRWIIFGQISIVAAIILMLAATAFSLNQAITARDLAATAQWNVTGAAGDLNSGYLAATALATICAGYTGPPELCGQVPTFRPPEEHNFSTPNPTYIAPPPGAEPPQDTNPDQQPAQPSEGEQPPPEEQQSP